MNFGNCVKISISRIKLYCNDSFPTVDQMQNESIFTNVRQLVTPLKPTLLRYCAVGLIRPGNHK